MLCKHGVKRYPNYSIINSKFYLHEVLIVKEVSSPSLTGSQLSESTVSKLTSSSNIARTIDSVNNNFTQEEYSLDKVIKGLPTTKFSIAEEEYIGISQIDEESLDTLLFN
jgi:hypothetical protein